jgi:hypothetical protein
MHQNITMDGSFELQKQNLEQFDGHMPIKLRSKSFMICDFRLGVIQSTKIDYHERVGH